jgi:hypothetical protein
MSPVPAPLALLEKLNTPSQIFASFNTISIAK